MVAVELATEIMKLRFEGWLELAARWLLVGLWGLPSRSLGSLDLNRETRTIADGGEEPLQGTEAEQRFQAGFRWNSDDDDHSYWCPQGLSSSADAAPGGRVAGQRWLVASWYHKEDEDNDRTRVSFVKMTSDGKPFRYRHVLLVEPYLAASYRSNFRDVPNHAGGVAWLGPYLYVADTHRGMRVFDTRLIKRVSTGDADLIGRIGNEFHAHDHRYVVPQVSCYYSPTAFLFLPRWSFCGVERTGDRSWLLTGEFKENDSGRLFWWPVGPSGLLEVNSGLWDTRASRARAPDVKRMQGALSRDNASETYISSTRGDDYLVLQRASGNESFSWIPKPEGLTYFPEDDSIWNLNEKRGQRVVIAVSRAALSGGS